MRRVMKFNLIWFSSLEIKYVKGGGTKWVYWGRLFIWGWIKPYLELFDFAENWYGESLQHILDAKKVLAAVCPPHLPSAPP